MNMEWVLVQLGALQARRNSILNWRKLAEFKHAPACIVLQAGFIAHAAVIPTITTQGDIIFSDELNHTSIIDGCRLSKRC